MITTAIQWFCYTLAASTLASFLYLAFAWIAAGRVEPEAHAELDTDDYATVIPIERARCQRVAASRCSR